jgi:hypothetical protein
MKLQRYKWAWIFERKFIKVLLVHIQITSGEKAI